MRKIKNLFIIFLFGLILVNPVLVFAQINNNSDAGSKTFNNPQIYTLFSEKIQGGLFLTKKKMCFGTEDF